MKMKHLFDFKLELATKTWSMFAAVLLLTLTTSCEEEVYPEAGSLPDETPPSAAFGGGQLEGDGDAWKTYSFSNLSSSATDFSWDFGNGNSSRDFEPSSAYSGEGTFSVTLTATDKNGASDTVTQDISIVEPPTPLVADPVLVNADFTKSAKSSGSDCACSAWINKNIGDQGESSDGNGSNVLKFDNNEPDAIYQEFAVTPNGSYSAEIVVQFKPLTSGGSYPSELEFRVLAGTGYVDGYDVVYYTDTVDFPQEDFGYRSIAQVETSANNLMDPYVLSNPGDDSYITYSFNFNVGANDSVALFARGIGGPDSGGGGSDLGYNSGDEEIRLDYILIEAIND